MLGRIERMLAALVTRRLSEFANDKRGVSAVEFAMLLPLMLTLYLGGVEVSQGISIDRKVTLTARTVADLVAQVSSIDTAGINAALGAATAIMAPYPDKDAKVTVSVVDIDTNGNAKVKWSSTKNGTARAVGSSVTAPGRAEYAVDVAGLGRGVLQVSAVDRLCGDRHHEPDRSDLHAAAIVGDGDQDLRVWSAAAP